MTAQQHDSPHDKSGVYSSTPIYREGIREQDIPSILSDFDLHLFGQGKEYRIYEKMGAHLLVVNGVTGVNFALWAPNARSVSVIGDFNGWRHGATPMHLRHQDLGVWECFVPGLTAEHSTGMPLPRASTTTQLRRAIPMDLLPNCARRRPVSSSISTSTSGKMRHGCRSVPSASDYLHRSPS